jgi:hypothetical protein
VTEAGAVYTPLKIDPTGGARDHETADVLVPFNTALNDLD